MKKYGLSIIWSLIGLFINFPVDAIIDPNVPAIFYPFGSDVGDSVAPVNDDGSTDNIPISMGFPFFNSTNVNLYVSASRTLPCVDLKWSMFAIVNYYISSNESIKQLFLASMAWVFRSGCDLISASDKHDFTSFSDHGVTQCQLLIITWLPLEIMTWH